jgi:lipopolysaccharide transport system ATP-binding protein
MTNSEIAVRVSGLSKRYRIGQRFGYGTLRESISNGVAATRRLTLNLLPFGSAGNSTPASNSAGHIWALNDVSFDVYAGSVTGVIGRNGAGKSTLLKVLSRITEPTTGRAEVSGRIGSLLEVGTGFHPELTGRENIYLNAIILGMTKGEVDKKFDEIVAFAGVEKFIDTPVKRYSSGMQLRLGFSVAAHLEQEIILVDEVLAVGDAEFQSKSIGKMDDIASDGRTVIVVSHNLGLIRRLCSDAIVLDEGKVHYQGSVDEAISRYQTLVDNASSMDLGSRTDRSGSGEVKLTGMSIQDATVGTTGFVAAGNNSQILVSFDNTSDRKFAEDELVLRASIFDSKSQTVAHISTRISGFNIPDEGEQVDLVCTIDKTPLNVGRYTMSVSIGTEHEIFDYVQDVCSFEMAGGNFYPTGLLPDSDHSATLLNYDWQRVTK